MSGHEHFIHDARRDWMSEQRLGTDKVTDKAMEPGGATAGEKCERVFF
jgi:hypothetical protein